MLSTVTQASMVDVHITDTNPHLSTSLQNLYRSIPAGLALGVLPAL